MRKPDFLIVGAPKCGTTALYDYLSQHPKIFMPQVKEPHYFARSVYDKAIQHTDDYLALFEDATADQLIGEASTWYLYLTFAADEIKDVCGDVKIIIMLRNPVDMMYSLHGHNVFKNHEPLRDFSEAMAAEADRRTEAARTPPDNTRFRDRVFYRAAATYSDKVQHYVDVFGKENVKVILYDDFKADNLAVYREVLAFLGLADFEPDIAPVNVNRQVRNPSLQRMVKQPPPLVRRMVRRMLPQGGRRAVGALIKGMNTQTGRREALDADTRQAFLEEFDPEIDRLSAVLDRDLSFWKKGKQS